MQLPLPSSEIPLLDQEERPCYLDSAATTLKPRTVIDRIARFYAEENAPVHRGVYELSQRATDLYEQARKTVAEFVGADVESLIFTKGTTEGLNLMARAWAEEKLKAGDEIVISAQEHHSNFTPWQEMARRTGATLHFAPLNANGTLDLEGALALIGNRTKLVAMSHVSNVLGIENPVREVFAEAKRVGAVTVLDAAQAVPTRPVDVNDLGCDALAFSAHKMLGPTGIGALAVNPNLLDQMSAYQTGGGMIERVAVDGTTYLDGAARYDAGTPNAAGAVGFAAACDYLDAVDYEGQSGMEAVAAYEHNWGQHAVEQVAGIEGIRMLGPPEGHPPEGGIVALQLDGIHPHDLAVLLDAQNVMVRAGHHCTMPLHAHLSSGGDFPETSLRASAYIYNTLTDAGRLADALKFAREALTRTTVA
ncbi:MAG: aminotransferase class V-fold PLP-dependent enzyme [Bacteroidetes bacterium]|nr:aminotransferase class V-fold PLP-dependent enzyme [Bacteroidota bacterium]